MKTITKSLIAIAIAAASLAAHAGGYTTTTATVSSIQVESAGKIVPSVAITSTPSCNTSNRFAVDLSTNTGRAMYAVAAMAYSLGKQVYMEGDGTCSLSSGSETLSYIKTTN